MASSTHLVLTSSGLKFEVSPETSAQIVQALETSASRVVTFHTFANRKKVVISLSHIVAIEIES